MNYTEQAPAEEFEIEDEQTLLIGFTAELLATHAYQADMLTGADWEEWLGDPDDSDGRLEPFRLQAEHLANHRMISWPEDTGPCATWHVMTPGPDSVEEPYWVRVFNTNTRAALEYYRELTAAGRPCRLRWAWTIQPNTIL